MAISPSPRGVPESNSRTPRGVWRHGVWGRAIWPLALIFGGASAYFLIVWVAQDNPTPQPSGTPLSPLQVEDLRSFTVRKGGQKAWEFRAARVQLSPDGKQTIAQNVSRAVLFQNGKTFLTLSAPQVRLSNADSNMEARGGVRASGRQGFAFQTGLARWKNQTQRIEIPGPVRARLHNLDFRAQNLVYDWKLKTLHSDSPVEIRTRGAVLQAGTVRASLGKRQVVMGGGVKLVFDTRQRPQLPFSSGVVQSNLKSFNRAAPAPSQTALP